jgi:uncharacterized protein
VYCTGCNSRFHGVQPRNDGIRYFPLPAGSSSSEHGLLAINLEYKNDGLLHPGGFAGWSTETRRRA